MGIKFLSGWTTLFLAFECQASSLYCTINLPNGMKLVPLGDKVVLKPIKYSYKPNSTLVRFQWITIIESVFIQYIKSA